MIIITVARKPMVDNYTQSILLWGTGSLNIDVSRISIHPIADQVQMRTLNRSRKDKIDTRGWGYNTVSSNAVPLIQDSGRWPANIILSPLAVSDMDEQGGIRQGMPLGTGPKVYGGGGGFDGMLNRQPHPGFGDSGFVSRYFKQVKE